jgi:Rrf2 family protein
MKELTKDTVLALHALQLMSKMNRAVTTEEIAQSSGYDGVSVARVIRRMKRAGVVRSHPRVGFALAKASGEISMREIIDAVDSPKAPEAPCGGDFSSCDTRASCILAPLCRQANEAFQKTLREFTLSELVDAPLGLPTCVDPKKTAKAS